MIYISKAATFLMTNKASDYYLMVRVISMILFCTMIIGKSAAHQSTLMIIDPPGPVMVYDIRSSSHHSKTILLKCNSSENITWEIPTLNFAELANQDDFIKLVSKGIVKNDLPSRTEISTSRNDRNDGFTSILTISNMTIWDEGYYTCRTTNISKKISSPVYIFPFGLRKSTLSKETNSMNDNFPSIRDIDPLRSYYTVNLQELTSDGTTTTSSMVLPCIFNNESHLHSSPEIKNQQQQRPILERKVGREWERLSSVVLENIIWNSKTRYVYFKLSFTEQDAGSFGIYRCVISEPDRGITNSKQTVLSEPFSILVEAITNKNGDGNLKPIIQPSVKYLVFQAGSTFNLTCQAKRSGGNVTWHPPESRVFPFHRPNGLPNERASIISETLTHSSQSGSTVSTLTVSNAGPADTGYYTCQSYDGNAQFFSAQYVFVQDLNTLVAFTFRQYRIDYPEFSQLREPFEFAGNNNNRLIYNVKFSRHFVVRIIPTSPLVDMVLSRQSSGRELQQIYPLTGIVNESENWSNDKFEGFSTRINSWDIHGSYEVVGSYARELSSDSNLLVSNIDPRQNRLSFSIYVEGMELSASNPYAVLGKPFTLTCRWRVRPFPGWWISFDWFWTSKEDRMYHDQIFKNFSIPIGAAKNPENWQSGFVESERIFESTLTFENLPLNASGTFECSLFDQVKDFRIGEWMYKKLRRDDFVKNYTMIVLEPKAPVITDSTYDNLEVDLGDEVTLSCKVDAIPPATVIWTDSQGSAISDGIRIYSGSSRTDLIFRVTSNFSGSGYGELMCHFNNSEGNARKTFTLILKGRTLNAGVYAAIGIAVVVFVIILSLLIRNIYFIKKRDKLVRLTRERLLRGDPGNINPEISLEEQVDLLPYNLKWEFPRNRIVLGKRLGAGQFGVVVEAKQIGTLHDPKVNNVRTVAVKMIKSSSDPTALVSLASELKIMIHLGPHLNVVNLLGACTNDVVNGELLVIEEFCRYGNVRDYLIANRDCFMINRSDEIRFSYKNLLEQDRQRQYDVVGALSSDHPLGTTFELKEVTHAQYSGSNQDEDQPITKSPNDDGYLVSTDPMSTNVAGIISPRNLICWSFQIASGMNHLANKKVIHGDLAARNILLAEGNVVKIADFGLSRQTKYNDGTYLKKGEEALPVKWMSIESLTDRIFTTQSDVWSYGVVLWELFSLGQMPFADVTTLKDLIRTLRNGERLEKPSLMPNPVGDIMAKCWEVDPKTRPTFSHIEREFGSMLGPDVENQYLKMNDPYIQMDSNI